MHLLFYAIFITTLHVISSIHFLPLSMINVETFSQTLFNDHNFQQLLRENVHSLSLELRERDLE